MKIFEVGKMRYYDGWAEVAGLMVKGKDGLRESEMLKSTPMSVIVIDASGSVK